MKALGFVLSLAIGATSLPALGQPAPPTSSPVAPAPPAAAAPSAAPLPGVPVSPVTPAPPAIPAATAADDRTWLKDVYEKAADSVVLIETELGTGSGFFFYSTRYVATALHVVDDADTIVVAMSSGQRTYARVVAYSRDNDVALVELEQPFPDAHVLAPYRGRLEIGETVAVIGHPFSGLDRTLPQLHGLLNWSLTEGVVGAVASSWLQTDAAINPGNSGGPVLNRRGEVLGVVSAKLNEAQGIGVIARIQRVDDLVPNIGRQPPPRQAFAFDGVELGFVINWADESIDGFEFGSGIRLVKRFPVRLRFGFLGGDIEPSSPTILATRLERFSTELTFGYALMLGDHFELSPYAGAAYFYDRRHDSGLRVDGNAACPAPPCLIEGRVVRSTELESRFLPLAGASLDFGHLSASYAYEFDLSDLDRSEHRVIFALRF